MSHVVFWYAAGWSFFIGAALIVGAAFVPPRRFARATSLVLVGALFVAPSSTPLPLLYWVALTAVTLYWWRSGNLRPGPRAVLIAAWTATFVFELTQHLTPRLDARWEGPVAVAVIGDSLTTWLSEKEGTTWPKALAKRLGIEAVHDYAVAGATSRSAMAQAERVPEDVEVVVVEIGGNDLLGRANLADFERDYDALLAKLQRPGRLLVGFELPLPPFHNRWGLAQRRAAAKHGVKLIPKWHLMNVLADPRMTVDSIHPTQAGQDALAKVVWSVLAPSITPAR